MRKFVLNKSCRFIVCLIGGIAPLATGCYSQSAARKYIEDAEKQWAESVPTNDAAVLKRVLADDFLWVYPSDGRLLWSKADTIADAESGPGDFVSNHLNEVTVRFFGMTAVAQGNESWVQKDKNGKEIKGRFIWSDVWVRRHGQWQMVQAQDQAIGP
jgi:ketosteroid isomerase-like protein